MLVYKFTVLEFTGFYRFATFFKGWSNLGRNKIHSFVFFNFSIFFFRKYPIKRLGFD